MDQVIFERSCSEKILQIYGETDITIFHSYSNLSKSYLFRIVMEIELAEVLESAALPEVYIYPMKPVKFLAYSLK